MKIAIVGAMPQEVELLVRSLENCSEQKIGSFTFYSGNFAGHQLTVLLSGIGKVSAAVGTALLIEKFSPELLINTGVAGGLSHTKINDVVLASEVAYHDVDVTAFGYQKGQQAQMPARFTPHPQWLSLAKKHYQSQNIPLWEGLVVSGDSFINSPKVKKQIETDFPQALAVEMEAGAIAQTCHLMQTPFLLLRAISDNANDNEHTLSYDTFVAQAAELSARMNLEFIRNI